MSNFNKVMLIGNVTRDLELSYLPSQTAVCEIGLAVNRYWTGPDGVRKEEVTWIDCSAFARDAETIAKYVKKGDPIFIEGRLKLDQWQAQDGTKRSRMRVVVEKFQFLSRGPGGGGYGGGAPQAASIPPEYDGESAGNAPAPAYAPRPQQRPAYTRPPVAGRPASQQPAAQPAPNYDAGDVTPDDAPPPIPPDDIPF